MLNQINQILKITEDQCYECDSKIFTYNMKIIPTGRSLNYPKFIPQIKQICKSCGKFKKFAIQTPKLIEIFNHKLEEIVVWNP